MKRREDNTDDRMKQGQHKRQAQIWTSQAYIYFYLHTTNREFR